MAYCRNCGAEMSATAKFCQECGQDQSVSVPQDQRIRTEDVPVPPPPSTTEGVSATSPPPQQGAALPAWAKGLLIIVGLIVLGLSFAVSPIMVFVALLVLIVAIIVLIFRGIRGRPLRNWVLTAAAAFSLVIAYGGVSAAVLLGGAPEESSSPSDSTRETADNSNLDMGETAPLSSGDTVTVYSYESPVSLDGPLEPKSGSELALVDAEFCAGQSSITGASSILSSTNFSLLMPDNISLGARPMGGTGLSPLLPASPNLFGAGDCVRGYVGFEKPEGQEPKFVLYEDPTPLSEPGKWVVN